MSLQINHRLSRLPRFNVGRQPYDLKRPPRKLQTAQRQSGQLVGRLDVERPVQDGFKKQFGELAADKKAFHDFMADVYGKGYDRAAAEQYRQKALQGDFSWLPKVEWVDSGALQGANGAYDAERGVVYLNSELKGDPQLASQTFIEEAGHHLDTKVNTTDTAGDEGEMFRRILSGEKLSHTQKAAIRAENDHGVIEIDGRKVQVEFWNPFKAIGKAVKKAAKAVGSAVKSVGKAIGKAAKAVGGAVKSVGKAIGRAAKGVGRGIATVAKGVVGAAGTFFKGIGGAVGGFFSNLVRFKFSDAFDSVVRGLDKAFLQAPARLVNSVINGTQRAFNGVTQLLGPLGKPLRNVAGRVFDTGRTIFNTGRGILRDGFRLVTEVPLGFIDDLGSAAGQLFRGNFKEAAKRFGMAFVNAPARALGGVVDIGARALQGAADIVGTGLFLQQPSRGLTSEEKDLLRQVYGDSIDVDAIRIQRGGVTEWFNMAPHTVGNTLYMRENWNGEKIFNSDGSLTDAGKELLVHEAAHAWQNQNGGGDYIHKSLWAQAKAAVGSGSRNAAYEWRGAAAAGTAFEDLNPEQQAHLIEDIGRALLNDGVVDASDWDDPSTAADESLSAAELAYVQAAWRQVQAGAGAP